MVKYKFDKFCIMNNQVCLSILLILGLSFLVYLLPLDAVHAEKIESGVTIKAPSTTETPTQGTCGLEIVSGVPINYGQLSPGQPSAEKQVMIKNTGNSQTPAKFTIKGGNWINDATGSTISGPEVTRAAIASVDYNNKKSLSLNGWELGQMTGGQTLPVYLQFLAWVNAPSGSFHQDVSIDLLC